MSQIDVLLPSDEGKIKAMNVTTGEVTTIDVNNPAPEHICRMIEVLRRRIASDAPNSLSVLKLVYLDMAAKVPGMIRPIVQDLCDGKLTREEADTKLIAYAATLGSSG